MIICALIAVLSADPSSAMPQSHLLRMNAVIQACREDIGAMAQPADEAAVRLVAGGAFYAAGQPSWVSELCGRAGGFMMLESLGEKTPASGDVVLYAQASGEPVPQALIDSGAYIVAFGGGATQPGVVLFSNHAEDNGVSPTLANAVPGWLFTGELVAALTRKGKMPVMWESIGTYSGITRANRLRETTGVRFHEGMNVPEVAAGDLANRFCDQLTSMLNRVESEERNDLDHAAAGCAEAKSKGRSLYMYSMGHLFPDEVGQTDIGKLFRSGVWNAGFRESAKPDDAFAEGDYIVHIGYQHPPLDLLQKAAAAGARVAYASVMPHRDYTRNDMAVWIDPMWAWEDACVAIEGYEVPVLAASGVINGAIAWEIYRLTTEKAQADQE